MPQIVTKQMPAEALRNAEPSAAAVSRNRRSFDAEAFRLDR
jgi:hypothetical protein